MDIRGRAPVSAHPFRYTGNRVRPDFQSGRRRPRSKRTRSPTCQGVGAGERRMRSEPSSKRTRTSAMWGQVVVATTRPQLSQYTGLGHGSSGEVGWGSPRAKLGMRGTGTVRGVGRGARTGGGTSVFSPGFTADGAVAPAAAGGASPAAGAGGGAAGGV